jgi:hypothetical protein
MVKGRLRSTVSGLVALAITSCVESRSQQLWRDPKYSSAPVHRIFVLTISPQREVQMSFENAVAQLVVRRGFEAATAAAILPPGQIDREKVEAYVKEMNVDLVVVQTVSFQAPMASPYEFPVTTSEANVYAAKVGAEAPIWTGSSRVSNVGSVQEAAVRVAGPLVDQLVKAQILVR